MKVQKDVESIAIICRRVEDGEAVPSEESTCAICGAAIFLSMLMKAFMHKQLDSGIAKLVCSGCRDVVPDSWAAEPTKRN